jgi:NAD(P)H-hydrate epimerase
MPLRDRELINPPPTLASLQELSGPVLIAMLVASAIAVLDGLLGTGLSADPREPQASAIRALNATGMRVFSIDVPSGLDATTGRVPAACVRANLTCTLAAMKTGLWAPSARAVAGSIVVADIGMPRAAWERCGLTPPAEVRGGGLSPLPSVTSP